MFKLPDHPGSSPHTRGAPALRSVHGRRPGIIPAYAGSTVEPSEMLTAQKDHPRIRGEHYVNSVYPALAAGSSPHTRGAPRRPGLATGCGPDHPRIRGEHVHAERHSVRIIGIIPAYAGSTSGAAG